MRSVVSVRPSLLAFEPTNVYLDIRVTVCVWGMTMAGRELKVLSLTYDRDLQNQNTAVI